MVQVGECWMNFGYWGPEVTVSPSKRVAAMKSAAQWASPDGGSRRSAGGPQYAAACRALVRLVGTDAQLCARDRCLDVGCGAPLS